MTVIVLATDTESIALAADQQWTSDADLVFFEPKLTLLSTKLDTSIVGAIATAGDALVGLTFEKKLKKALQKNVSIDAVHKVIADTDKIPPALLVLEGVGYVLDDEGLLLPTKSWAIGTGGKVALGAMWGRKGPAKRLAQLGCKAAIALTASCGGEIDVFEMALDTSY